MHVCRMIVSVYFLALFYTPYHTSHPNKSGDLVQLTSSVSRSSRRSRQSTRLSRHLDKTWRPWDSGPLQDMWLVPPPPGILCVSVCLILCMCILLGVLLAALVKLTTYTECTCIDDYYLNMHHLQLMAMRIPIRRVSLLLLGIPQPLAMLHPIKDRWVFYACT